MQAMSGNDDGQEVEVILIPLRRGLPNRDLTFTLREGSQGDSRAVQVEKICLLGNQRSNMTPACHANDCGNVHSAFIHCIVVNRTHVKVEGNHILLLSLNRSG